MSITTIPKITWDTSFTKTLNFGYLLDNPVAYSQPIGGSSQAQFVSGEEDAWTIRTEYILEFDFRYIPTEDTTNPIATGWDVASDGVRLFLESARDKVEFRFFSDKDSGTFILSRLAEPIEGAPTLEVDGTRRIRMAIRNVSSPYVGY